MPAHKILVVDDEHSFAEFAKMLLELHGYEALIARTGGQAMESARAQKPDLILMDFYMSDMSGTETIRRLKSDPQTAAIPVILCSMTKSRAEIQDAFDGGAVDFLAKPLKPPELAEKVKKALARHPE